MAASRESLQQLIEQGLLALSPTRLGDLADWCWDWCEATGDGRYCGLARTFGIIADWFGEHDRYGGVPADTVVELDGLLGRELPMVLAATDPASGAMLGRELREAVLRLVAAV